MTKGVKYFHHRKEMLKLFYNIISNLAETLKTDHGAI